MSLIEAAPIRAAITGANDELLVLLCGRQLALRRNLPPQPGSQPRPPNVHLTPDLDRPSFRPYPILSSSLQHHRLRPRPSHIRLVQHLRPNPQRHLGHKRNRPVLAIVPRLLRPRLPLRFLSRNHRKYLVRIPHHRRREIPRLELGDLHEHYTAV